MSFYFTRFAKHIKQTKIRYDYKREDFNKYINNLEKTGIEFSCLGLNDHPETVRNNPYFWKHLTKIKIKQSINLKKNIDIESNTSEVTTRINIHSVATFTKKVVKGVINAIVGLVRKVTGGHVDVNKIYDVTKEKISEVPILNKINKNNLILVKDVTKYVFLVSAYRILNIIKRNKGDKTDSETAQYYENLSKNLLIKIEKQKSLHLFEKLKLTFKNTFLTSKLFYTDAFKKMNNYINASYMERKYYIWMQKFKNYFGISQFSTNGIKDKIMNIYYRIRISELKKVRSIRDIKGIIGNKFRKILVYVLGFLLIYYGLKYFFYKLKMISHNKKLEDALQKVRELEAQNEELLKYNQELVNRLNNN
jgi:hypothetical protein